MSNKIKPNTVFQYSTLSALLEGVYDGELSVGELKQYGNYGIGTFNALDGELLLFDGFCYKAQSNSQVVKVNDDQKIPFATACYFIPDTVVMFKGLRSLQEVENQIDSIVPSTNLLYAYKITGEFDSIIIRSVPKQEKPYLRLIEAFKKQGVYTYEKENGVLFGYKFPNYLKDVNMNAFHLHFLSDDKSRGGHLLSCKLKDVTVEVAFVRNYQLELPNSAFFNQSSLTNKRSELTAIEGGR